MTIDLKWGETPWDSLTREELLREVQTMAAALSAARGVMRLCKINGPSEFWSYSSDSDHLTGLAGSGGIAVHKAGVALRRYDEAGDSALYSSFFRYADSLLFPRPDGTRGPRGWMVCSECGTMTMNDEHGIPVGLACRKQSCGTMRLFTWDDLRAKVTT